MDRVCIYLRKSRQDEELEHLTGDTLAHHRKELLRFAKLHGHNIIKIHEEVVSGDSIFHRPEMVEMLKEIELKLYDAVLVMDIDRLGRGDLQDQGMILNTFKKAGTLIITPEKTYDLENEIDEQFSELKAFVSRQEYRMITKRLKAGQRRFVEEGNYIPPLPPYGYKIIRTDHVRTLEIVSEQAEVIKLMFEMFINGTGIIQISRELNSMGYKSYYGNKIEPSWVSKTLKNPIYCGKIAWGRKEIKKSSEKSGKRTSLNRPKDKHLIVDGKHPAIIDEELFNEVQIKINEEHPAPINRSRELVNPLSGLIKCKNCGHAMRMHHFLTKYNVKQYHLCCGSFCGTAAAPLYLIERAVIKSLFEWFERYKSDMHTYKIEQTNKSIKSYDKKIATTKKLLQDLQKQKNKLHELVEKNVYDIPTFLERSKVIANDIEDANKMLETLEIEMNRYEANMHENIDVIPKIQHIKSNYEKATPAERNEMLKGIITRINYSKVHGAKPDGFEIELITKY